jgi:EAL domain-containing protein (putative c-di-GMP-specific phosphodiesterase class I)
MSEDIRGFRRYLSDKTILDRLAEQEEFEKAPRYDPQEVSEICDDSDHKSVKDREIERLLSEIVDILNKANTECLDHYRSKQEEKIVLTGFRRLCDIHAALFKKRSDYEIYGSRIINDLLNSVNLQAQKQAYDQEEIKRIDKAERESFDSLRELYFAIAEMLGVNNDKEMIAKIKELAEIKAEIALGNIGVLSNLSYEFRSQIKQALYEGVRKDKYPSIDEFPDDDAISFVEHLIDRHKHWGRDHEFTQFALEVKQLLIDSVGKDISNEEAIAEIIDLKENQGDGRKKLVENLEELLEKERLDSRNLCNQISDLRHDLIVANKVIARLVGE